MYGDSKEEIVLFSSLNSGRQLNGLHRLKFGKTIIYHKELSKHAFTFNLMSVQHVWKYEYDALLNCKFLSFISMDFFIGKWVVCLFFIYIFNYNTSKL